jgi:hypothetical protein
MMWFFERREQILELETRYDNETAEYVLELREPDVAPETERLMDALAFRARLVDVWDIASAASDGDKTAQLHF